MRATATTVKRARMAGPDSVAPGPEVQAVVIVSGEIAVADGCARGVRRIATTTTNAASPLVVF